ncbi:unnamed protein product [Candidula unifasciata]|uniref:[histone H4]-lysine(20) N-methyltransferase n=1 Tax=Candidula unifasciata TaxID=100452 RepID=A0A8S3ZBZ3_9EUPU|nr:unnamed protein product [Candidula unifasciata]
METTKKGSVAVDALSPSRITDYFNSSRTKSKDLNLHCGCEDVNTDSSQVLVQLAEKPPVHLQSTESLNSKPSKSRHAKGRNPDTVSETSELQATSPSVPRPKLRKSTKSNSQADALSPASNVPAKPKPVRRKKKEPEPVQKNVITDFFPVRRSGRITKSEIEKEKHHQLEQMILSKCEDGLKVTDFDNKGRGVVATKEFEKGDFIVEYAGELIDTATAKQREKDYAANPEIGCYMYFFNLGPKSYCVDATAESGRLGRLINHSREGNCCTKSVIVNSRPRLILLANKNIRCGEELSYDYGDRSKAAIEAHPWLKL